MVKHVLYLSSHRQARSPSAELVGCHASSDERSAAVQHRANAGSSAHGEDTARRHGRGHSSLKGDSMDVQIALRELLPTLGFSRVVVEGRSRALVLADGSGSWGSSRRFVARMADPGMVPARDPRCHRGTRELVRLAHSMRDVIAAIPALLQARWHTLAHYSSRISRRGEATCCR